MSLLPAFLDAHRLIEATTDALLRSALAGGLLIGAVWLLCRLVPAIPPRVRAALWWTVCLKLLVGCVWLTPVELPLLPAPATPAALGPAAEGPVERGPVTIAPQTAAPAPDELLGEHTPGPGTTSVPWRPIVLLLWLVGAGGGFALDLRSLRSLRRTVRQARAPEPGPTAELFRELVDRLGFTEAPRLLVTQAGTTPQAVGLLRPTVLLPSSALDAPRAELAMVLTHELIHLRRRDLWLAWVPLLARRLFFFHPLAPLAQREHALAREAACDAEVLTALGTAPRAYGRLLVRWGVAPRETGLAAAGAAPSVQLLKRRLQMLHRTSTKTRRSSPWWWLCAAALTVALVPVTIVAQAPPAPPSAPAPPSVEAPPAPEAPPTAATAAPPAPARAPAALATASAPPSPPTPAVAPVATPDPPEAPEVGTTWTWSDSGDSFALLSGDSSVWVHGSSTDSDKVRALRRGDEPLFWFRRDGSEYVVRDPKLIDRAREILTPQMELAKQQAELGRRQGELGAKQGTLGARQGELGAKQGALGGEQAKLAARQAALAGEAVPDLERRMEELAARQRELADQQQDLGVRQRELAAPQRELGERQRELGERQREVAERAQEKIERLIDQAIVTKKAERID